MTQKPIFRMTSAWPGYEVPVPRVPVAEITQRVGSTSPDNAEPDWWIMYDGATTKCEVPTELVIRELPELDCSDDQAVIDFVGRYGIINRTAESSGLLVKRRQRRGNPGESWDVAIDDVRLHLQEVQALARHWLAFKLGRATADAWAGLIYLDGDEVEAAALFVERLNNGLRWMHARVEGEWAGEVHRISTGVPDPGLYSALCLQLYNLVVSEEAELRRCRSCGLPFVRQRGRAKEGQYHSKGVIYCSKKCANREAARALRERKKRGENE